MSVDLYVYRRGLEITEGDLAAAVAALPTDSELVDDTLMVGPVAVLSLAHREGWVEPEMEPLEQEVYASGHLHLSGPPEAWGWLLGVAKELAEGLRAVVFDPQESEVADLSDAPSWEELRASLSEPANPTPLGSDRSAVGVSAVSQWVTAGWLELADDAAESSVDVALEALVEAHRDDVSAFIDALLDVPGVEEVFATDAEVERFLEVW